MKRGFKIIAIISIITLGALVLIRYNKNFELRTLDKNITWKLKVKGVKEARDFAFDEEGNFYIAFKDKIQYIDSKGKSFLVFKDSDLDINSIVYKEKNIYFSSKDKVFCYNIDNKNKEVMVDNIPNFGDYNKSKLLLKDDFIFITIGAATNSGVVGEDNKWIVSNPFNHDITPKAITIKGKNFLNGTTGAFVPFKTKNVLGQIIPSHFPGNGSLIRYSIKNKASELYAWGIRNMEGIDYDSAGKIIATVGGMEDRGLRPIKGDSDYIYEIKQNLWYGWPDYSGGDPVDSPRFKEEGNKSVSFLLDKHPSTNPPAPLYQYDGLSALGNLSIDRKGIFGEKDSIYFYSSKENSISSLNKSGVLQEKVKFIEHSNICSLKFKGDTLNILDNKQGCIYEIYKEQNSDNIIFKKEVVYCSLAIIVMLIVAILWNNKN